MMQRAVRLTAAMALVLAMIPGCTKVVTGAPMAVSGNDSSTAGAVSGAHPGAADGCTQVDVPLQDVPAHTDGEPRVRVPQPAGWNRVTKMDSEVIRYTLVNQSLIADHFAPNLVVTLESTPPLDPQVVFDQQVVNLRDIVGATDVSSTPATVCGLPAARLTLKLPAMGVAVSPRPAQGLAVVAGNGGHQFLITATAQTTDVDNPTYQRDAATMLDGFEVLAPNQ